MITVLQGMSLRRGWRYRWHSEVRAQAVGTAVAIRFSGSRSAAYGMFLPYYLSSSL